MDGDSVYYKRENDDRWKGPAKGLSREGRTLHLSHGNTTTKVHESKVAKRDVEFSTTNVIPRETQSVPVSESNETVGDISEGSDDDNAVTTKNVFEKRLRNDIAALRIMLEEKEADSLTKNGDTTYNLRQVIQYGKLNFN